MTNKRNGIYLYDGLKTSLLWDEESDAWTYLSGAPETDTQAMYRVVPTLFRGVTMIANSVYNMPFAIYGKGDKEIDTSANYKNVVGFLKKPRLSASLISMSLDMSGRGYLKRSVNDAQRAKDMIYLAPQFVTPNFDPATGNLLNFKRQDIKSTVLNVKDVVYFWLPDPYVEVGPPKAWPAQTALAACGVLANLSTFVSLYFKRGAIRPMLVYAKGVPSQEERERMETWFSRMFNGLRNAFQAKVFNSDTMSTETIGDGLDQLRDVELTNQNRQDIAHALGIPYALLFSEAANNATLTGDTLNFYKGSVEPRCEFIAATLNEQLFEPAGYHFEYLPETLDIYQTDEADRAAALGQVVTALADPQSFVIASQILGYEIPAEAQKLIDQLIADKEARRKEMEALTQAQPPQNGEPQNNNQPPQQPPADQQQIEQKAEMDKWKRKAIKAAKSGKSPAVEFISDTIPPVVQAAIAGALEACNNAEDVHKVFQSQWIGYP